MCNAVLDNVRAIASAFIQRLAGLSDLMFLGKKTFRLIICLHKIFSGEHWTLSWACHKLAVSLADWSFYSSFLKNLQISFQKAKGYLKFSPDVKHFVFFFPPPRPMFWIEENRDKNKTIFFFKKKPFKDMSDLN